MARHLVHSLLFTSLFSALGSAGKCRPTNPDFCRNDVWGDDVFLRMLKEPRYNDYAKEVCTSTLQPTVNQPGGGITTVTVGGGTATIKTTVTEGTTETRPYGTTVFVETYDATEYTRIPIATSTITEGTDIITVIVNGGGTSTVTDETVYTTVATKTEVLRGTTRTHAVTQTDIVGATSTVTVTRGSETKTTTVFSSTETFYTQTEVDWFLYTYSTNLDVRTTGTRTNRYTSLTTKSLVRATDVVGLTKTVFETQLALNTVVDYTNTIVDRPYWTTVTLKSTTGTETQYETTLTKTAYQTVETVRQTVVTGTETDVATKTTSIENLVTEFSTIYTGTTTHTYSTAIEYQPDYWKRGAGGNPGQFDEWVAQYGADHVKSACSCVVKFPLPTRAVGGPSGSTVRITITPIATIVKTETQTQVQTIDGSATFTSVTRSTRTITIPITSFETVRETIVTTLTIDGSTHQLTTKTVTRPTTRTVTDGGTKDVTVTVTKSGGVKTVEVKHTVVETRSGVTTESRKLDLTSTSSIIVVKTSHAVAEESLDVLITQTDYYDVTSTQTIPFTTTVLTTGTRTVKDILTLTSPVAKTIWDGVGQTITLFVDGTTTIPVSYTTTVGVITRTTVVTYVTVGQDITRTITTTIALEETVSAVATATETCSLPIVNGGFDDDKDTDPWFLSWNDQIGGYVDSPGMYGNSPGLFHSNDMNYNWLLEMYQDMATCPDTNFECSFYYYFDSYYETPSRSDPYNVQFVPYVRAYLNDETRARGNCYPSHEGQVGHWRQCWFEYTSASDGQDRFWFDAASPQPYHDYNLTYTNENDEVEHILVKGGNNFLLIDNVECHPV